MSVLQPRESGLVQNVSKPRMLLLGTAPEEADTDLDAYVVTTRRG